MVGEIQRSYTKQIRRQACLAKSVSLTCIRFSFTLIIHIKGVQHWTPFTIILFHIKSNTKDDVIIKLIRIFRTHKKVKPTITHMKMILFRLICLKTCLLLIPVLYAQNNYRPGFIITVQKDTIYGEIDYRTDKMNAKRCVFQSQGNDIEPVTYHPFEILGYRFTDDGKYYVSKNIELKYGVSTPVFLEYLLQGMKSLYYYETEDNIPIYFVEDNNTIVKIDAPKLSKQATNIQFKGQTDRYIPFLHYAFKDCPSLAPQIDRARFSRKEMIKITKEYHYAMCTSNEDCIEFEAKEDKRSIQLDITPYVGVIQYNVPSGSLIGLYSSPELSYLAGVTLAISNRRWMSSLSGCFDVSFSRITSSARSLNNENSSTIFKHSGTMFSGKLGIRYTYPKGMARPFVELGADFSGMINAKIKINDKSERWLDGVYPGYYANAGVNFKLSRKNKQMICIRSSIQRLKRHDGKISPRLWDGQE